ncbi:MAG: hypothetical protein JHC87_04690 [Thermoleophilaceae bacterium]|nr:hypothetical protein [Thermoleophilaceae bacterium]
MNDFRNRSARRISPAMLCTFVLIIASLLVCILAITGPASASAQSSTLHNTAQVDASSLQSVGTQFPGLSNVDVTYRPATGTVRMVTALRSPLAADAKLATLGKTYVSLELGNDWDAKAPSSDSCDASVNVKVALNPSVRAMGTTGTRAAVSKVSADRMTITTTIRLAKSVGSDLVCFKAAVIKPSSGMMQVVTADETPATLFSGIR